MSRLDFGFPLIKLQVNRPELYSGDQHNYNAY